MEMVFRWFGEENDHIPLAYIKQIPGMSGIAWALHDIPAGEEWPLDRIMEVKNQSDKYEMNIDVVESLNVHEDIKLGLPTRDVYIENFIKSMKHLASVGVKVICYNFMPVFDWVRTELHKKHKDGSTSLFLEKDKIVDIDPMEIVKLISHNSHYTMPGWEPDRLQDLTTLFEQYRYITAEDIWNHLAYFLKSVIPVAEELNIKLAIHPDDPPFSVFGLPRIITNKANLQRVLHIIDSPANGLTFCSGSLGASHENDLVDIVRTCANRIHFAHVRNIKLYENGNLLETSHKMSDGSLDIYGIMKAFYESNFSGYMRPDHGRHIWDEEGRPGYGLYDRGLGTMYLWGIWDSFVQSGKEKVNAAN